MAEKEEKVSKFKILSHTADLKIKFFGKDKEELFRNALLGMQSSLKVPSASSGQGEGKEETKERKMSLSSDNLESLLVDFLSEINYLNETKKEIFKRIEFEELTNTKLKAKVFSKKVKRFGLIIKGISYHELEIKKKDGSWQGIVLFDI